MDSGTSVGREDGSEGDSAVGPDKSSYRCNYPDCGKQYTRASHLARHRQSHQDIKPHQCDICGKGFTRQDVLSRHKRRQHVEGNDETVDEPDSPGKMDTEKDGPEPASAKVTTPQDPWGFQYTPDKHTSTLMQADLRNIVISAQAALAQEEPSQEQNQVTHPPFHHFTSSQSLLPPPAPAPAMSTSSVGPASASHAWNTNNFDLDSLFFDTSTFATTPAVNTTSSLNDDIKSILANWSMPGQPVIGSNGQQMSEAPAATSTLNPSFDVQNDDFLHWLSNDIGTTTIGQPLTFSTPEALYGYLPSQEQPKPFVNSSEGAFQFSMSSERGNEPVLQNGQNSAAHPSLQHGIRTRPPSPSLPQQSEHDVHWPMTWEPNRMEHDAGLSSNVIEFSDVHGIDDNAEEMSFITMDETCRLAMLELLHFAQLPANAYHRLYVRLSRLPLSVLNSFLGIYFNEMYPYLPFLHKPTFDPRKCSGFLLTIMIALGAQMSKLSGYFLGDLVHAAFSKVVDADRILLREVKMLQTMLLWSFLRYNGLRRLMEMAEVFRGAYAVPLGRMHGFDDKIPFPLEVHDVSQPLERRWQIWRAWETRRRTGFASLLSEAEFTTLLNRPPVIVPREMQTRLPCSDDCWNAANAHDWANIYFDKETASQCSFYACDVVDGRPSVLRELAKGARRSAFASTVLIQMLHMNVWTVRQCGSSNSPSVRAMLQEIQRSLTMVACSENEFTPYQETRSSAWRGAAILYHYAQMASRIPVPTLLALAGKESAREAAEAQKALSEWLNNNPVSGREVALHAGQCWKLIRQSSLRATYGPFCLLYSALVLYTCATSSQVSQLDSEFMQHSSDEEDYISLDCDRPGVMELNYVQTGLAAVKLGEIPFTSPSAGRDILATARTFMEQNDSWGLTSGLSRVLAKVEERARSELQQEHRTQEGIS